MDTINTKISEYLKKVVDKSNDKLSTEFDFSRFDKVNIYLIQQALNKRKHLWLKPCDDKIVKFYQSIIFAVAVDFFEKNYCESENYSPKIGDKYQKKNKRYKVIEVNCEQEGIENPIKLKCINKNKDYILTISITTLINDYAKLDKSAGVTNRNTFKPMLDFVEKMLGERENIPSFPHKFAVVAQKNNFESCFSQLDKRAFPYTYIADSGEETKNLPASEPMFFVVSSYETIQTYIFDKDISLDTIIFMGNKYDYQLQQDIDRGYFQKGIFIGKKKPDTQRLLKWRWTLPEYQYFDGLAQGEIKTIEVNNEMLERNILQFVTHIEQLEKNNYIDLKRLYSYVAYIYPLIVLSDGSRLKNQIDGLSHRFRIKSEQILGEEFSNSGTDCEEAVRQLVDDFQMILEQINFENNAKTHILQQAQATDYLLIPDRQTLNVWETEIKELDWLNTEVISFSKLKSLGEQSSITVLSLTDYDFYCAIRDSRHHINWLLYDQEYQYYKKLSNRYVNELIGEYRSIDRKELVNIDYSDEIQPETPDKLIDRVFDDDAERQEHTTTYQDHINKRIIFTDNSCVELSANSAVILISQIDKPLKHKVGDLKTGDKIRTYENQHKDVLFDIAVNADRQGKFKEILDSSKLWKDKLTQCCADDEKRAEIADRCDVKSSTVSGWLDDNSKTKFPQHIEPLKNLLGNDYQKILKSKQNYNSIMIALGRDLSDEITDYIITNEKGELLKQFDDDSIKAISEHNMPIQEIKRIDFI